MMRLQAFKARPRRRRPPPDPGEPQVAAVAANVLRRSFPCARSQPQIVKESHLIYPTQEFSDRLLDPMVISN